MLKFKIPGHPVGKARPRFVANRNGKGGRAYSTETTINYEALVKSIASKALEQNPEFPPNKAYHVTMQIDVAVPASWSKKRKAMALNGLICPTTKPDIDNVEKIIFDGLNGIVWNDDKQVVDVTKNKRYAEMPSVFVSVEVIGEAA